VVKVLGVIMTYLKDHPDLKVLKVPRALKALILQF
jgi:hypothetical protein